MTWVFRPLIVTRSLPKGRSLATGSHVTPSLDPLGLASSRLQVAAAAEYLKFERLPVGKKGSHKDIYSFKAVPKGHTEVAEYFIDKQTMEAILELFPRLAERLSHYGNRLSGGEQQMLTVGRALMTNPDVLILDDIPLTANGKIRKIDIVADIKNGKLAPLPVRFEQKRASA